MNGKLEPKPDKFTLDYALQLGWNLTDAVYMQLQDRGAAGIYNVQGIYSEGGEVFVILQDITSLEFVRCSLEITGQDTVVLGTEMIAVSQTWTPKAPAEPEPVQSLGGDPAQASQDPASTLSTQAEPAPAPASQPAPAGSGNFTDNGEPSVSEPAAEPVAEPAAEPAAEPTAEPTAEPASEPTAEPAPATDPAAQFTAQEPEAEPAQAEPTATEPTAEPEPEPTPATDFAALTAQVADLQAQLAASNEKVTALEAEVSTYKAAEATATEQKKNDLVTAYSALLTEDEMKPILEKKAELSVDDFESKLAVVFARKQQSERTYAAQSLQVNIGSIGGDAGANDNLPDFMKQALEIDAQMRGGITLKP